MRCYAEPHSYTNANTESDTYSYSDCVANCDSYGYIYAYTNPNSYTYFDTETFTDAETGANTQAAPYSSASPVDFVMVPASSTATQMEGRAPRAFRLIRAFMEIR